MFVQITWIALISGFGLASSAATSSTKVSRPYSNKYEYNIDHSDHGHWNGKVIDSHGIRILDGAHYGGLYGHGHSGHGVATSSSNFNLKPYGSAYGYNHDLSSHHDYNQIEHAISYANANLKHDDDDDDHEVYHYAGLYGTDGYSVHEDDDDDHDDDHYRLLSGYGYGSAYDYHRK